MADVRSILSRLASTPIENAQMAGALVRKLGKPLVKFGGDVARSYVSTFEPLGKTIGETLARPQTSKTYEGIATQEFAGIQALNNRIDSTPAGPQRDRFIALRDAAMRRVQETNQEYQQSLQSQRPSRALPALGKAALGTIGTLTMAGMPVAQALTSLGVGGVLGGGINKLFGGDVYEGVVGGVGQAPLYTGIGQAGSKVLGKVAPYLAKTQFPQTAQAFNQFAVRHPIAGTAIKRFAEGATGGVITGALQPADTGEERWSNIKSMALMGGAFSAGSYLGYEGFKNAPQIVGGAIKYGKTFIPTTGHAGYYVGKKGMLPTDRQFSFLFDRTIRSEIGDTRPKVYANRIDWDWDNVNKNLGKTIERPLTAYFRDDQLFTRYPKLKDYTIRVYSSTGPESGWAHPTKKIIAVNAMRERPVGFLDTIVHELQHSVDKIEGYPRGSSPMEFIGPIARAYQKAGYVQPSGTPLQSYLNVSEEMIARDASRRAALTPAQRAEIPPLTERLPSGAWTNYRPSMEQTLISTGVGKVIPAAEYVRGPAQRGMQVAAPTEQTKGIAQVAYGTTIESGGTTINLQGIMPSKGFAVSPYKDREVRVAFDKVKTKDVISYIQRNQDILNKPEHFLGLWVQDGKVFIDTSVVKPTERAAQELGNKAHQYAIFDLGTFREIPTQWGLKNKPPVGAQAKINIPAGQQSFFTSVQPQEEMILTPDPNNPRRFLVSRKPVPLELTPQAIGQQPINIPKGAEAYFGGVQSATFPQSGMGTFSMRTDRLPRYEIPEQMPIKMKINGPMDFFEKSKATSGPSKGKFVPKKMTLKDIFEDKNLFAAYPKMKDVRISATNDADSYAAYNPKNNTMTVSIKGLENPNVFFSSLFHEIQHAIQTKEGFASGANPADEMMAAMTATPAKEEKLMADWQSLTQKFLKGNTTLEMAKQKAFDELTKRFGEPLYRRSAGEIEAQNVSQRAGMTMAKRMTTPLKTFGPKVSELISRTPQVSPKVQAIINKIYGTK